MRKTSYQILISFLVLATSVAKAQTPEMADQMRSEGKIYVVVAILLVVVIGLVAYLFSIDRKVSRIEKAQEKKSQ